MKYNSNFQKHFLPRDYTDVYLFLIKYIERCRATAKSLQYSLQPCMQHRGHTHSQKIFAMNKYVARTTKAFLKSSLSDRKKLDCVWLF